ADEGARAQRSVPLMLPGKSKSSSLRSRPHPALRATFSRFAGEGLIPNLAARDGKEALLPFTGEGARRADEGARAQRRVLLMLPGKGKSSSLRLRPHPALRATFSRFAGEGLIPNLAARVGKEALLPFTGEGARRADEGARAQRSVPLMLPGRSKSSSLRSRPHPALRATFSRFAGEGLIPNLAARDGEEALLPFTGEGARRADEGARAQRSVPLMLPGKGKSSSLRSRPHPALRATFSRCAGEGLVPNLAARVGKEALLPFTGEGARRADEGARAERSVLLMLPGKGKSSSLRSRPHPALRATFSRFAGEGLIPNLAARDGKEALLPFTGEGLNAPPS